MLISQVTNMIIAIREIQVEEERTMDKEWLPDAWKVLLDLLIFLLGRRRILM